MLMYLTAAFMWVSIWRVQDLWPILGKLQLPIVLEILLGASLLASLGGPRRLQWTKSRVLLLPFVLLVVMTAGVPFGLWPGNSFIFVTRTFLPSLLLLLGIAFGIREIEDANWLAFTHLIGATVYSGWTYLFISVGSDGRLAGGVHYDANDIALLLVATIPFALYFLRPGVAVRRRLYALFSLVLFVALMIKCASRGGFIAFVIVLLYVTLAFRAVPVRMRIGAVAATVLVMMVFGSATYWNMMETIAHPKDDYNMTSPVGRKAIWKRGVGYMLAHPILGVGANNFPQAEGSVSEISRQYASENRGLKWSTAHNSFVLVGAELGIGGLIAFVTMIGTSFKHLSSIKTGRDEYIGVTNEDEAFAQALIASLIGFCVAGFFVSAAYSPFLLALIGLVVGIDSLRRRRIAKGALQPVKDASASAGVPRERRKRLASAHWLPAG